MGISWECGKWTGMSPEVSKSYISSLDSRRAGIKCASILPSCRRNAKLDGNTEVQTASRTPSANTATGKARAAEGED